MYQKIFAYSYVKRDASTINSSLLIQLKKGNFYPIVYRFGGMAEW